MRSSGIRIAAPQAILDGKVASGTRATGKNVCTRYVASPTVNNPMHVRERKIGNFPIPECDVTGRIIMIGGGVFLFYTSKEQHE